MKVVIQRVNKAKVSVFGSGKVVGEIQKGLFILVAVKKGDSLKQAEELALKVIKMRIMADRQEKMNLAVTDVEGAILAVSQFTLYANTKDGNRPSFIEAELPEKAREIYEHFVKILREKGAKVETGSFGKYMIIEARLDGPVTIVVEN